MILLHEMAHMWFGDLVTMRWWDDLWLNEAFASWASTWASENATDYTDADATFLAGLERAGYQADMSPASHPIRAEVPDVAHAFANFDQITYAKGQAVLRQLTAFVGEDMFVEGLRAYFRDHAWGNTVLDDLIGAIGTAADRDLTDWTASWLDRAGTDTIVLLPDPGAPHGARSRRRRARTAANRAATTSGSVRTAAAGTRTLRPRPSSWWRPPTWRPRVRRPPSSCPTRTCTCSTTAT